MVKMKISIYIFQMSPPPHPHPQSGGGRLKRIWIQTKFCNFLPHRGHSGVKCCRGHTQKSPNIIHQKWEACLTYSWGQRRAILNRIHLEKQCVWGERLLNVIKRSKKWTHLLSLLSPLSFCSAAFPHWWGILKKNKQIKCHLMVRSEWNVLDCLYLQCVRFGKLAYLLRKSRNSLFNATVALNVPALPSSYPRGNEIHFI